MLTAHPTEARAPENISAFHLIQEQLIAFLDEPVFSSYVRALGFTLAKVDLSIWRMYLDTSSLDKKNIQGIFQQFEDEYVQTLEMLRFITQQQKPLWFKPFLASSIRLRSPMIHPLNLLQIIACREKDFALLRLTVTGISSGMLTTG